MSTDIFFNALERVCERPRPFEHYTTCDLWTDAHTSERMLAYHLNGDVDMASRTTAFIERSVGWLVSYFAIGPGTEVADFGCGPGLYTTRLARTGAAVTGVDFSERSLRHARELAGKEGLSIDYHLGSYLEYETDRRFDLALMIMCDFCALSPTQRDDMLQRFYRLLKPGGAVLLDAYSLRAFAERRETAVWEVNLLDGFWAPGRYHGFLNTFKYEHEKVVLDKYTIVELERIRTVYNWLQYFEPEALAREFEGRGFTVEKMLANVAGDPPGADDSEFAVVARKPVDRA